MGVDINKTRCNQRTIRVDLALSSAGHLAYFNDQPVLDRYVCGKCLPTGSVYHRTGSNDHIVLSHTNAPPVSPTGVLSQMPR
jgi:hypothetical protein